MIKIPIIDNKIITLNDKAVSVEVENPLQTLIDTRKSASYLLYGYQGETAEFLADLDFTNVTSMEYMFEGSKLTKVPKLKNIQNITDMKWMFNNCDYIQKIEMDTSGATYMYSFVGCCDILEEVSIDASNAVNISSSFTGCPKLKKVNLVSTAKVSNFTRTFNNCYELEEVTGLDTSNATHFSQMFGSCKKIKNIDINTEKNTSSYEYFAFDCFSLVSLKTLNADKNNNFTYSFLGCGSLETVVITNIRVNLSFLQSSKLTITSLLGLIQELIQDTSTAHTLTVGTTNMAKLENVYVKLIETTEEENYIKLPFEVCESTDEGAMSIFEYVTLKNWGLA